MATPYQIIVHDSNGTTRALTPWTRFPQSRPSGIATRDQGETPFYPAPDPGPAGESVRPSTALTAEEIARRGGEYWRQSQNIPLVADPGLGRRTALARGDDMQRRYDAHWGRDAGGGRLMRHVVDLDPVEGGEEGTYQGSSEAGEHHELRRQGEGFSLWREEPGADVPSNDRRRQSSDCRCSDRALEVRKHAALQRDYDGWWRGRIQ